MNALPETVSGKAFLLERQAAVAGNLPSILALVNAYCKAIQAKVNKLLFVTNRYDRLTTVTG